MITILSIIIVVIKINLLTILKNENPKGPNATPAAKPLAEASRLRLLIGNAAAATRVPESVSHLSPGWLSPERGERGAATSGGVETWEDRALAPKILWFGAFGEDKKSYRFYTKIRNPVGPQLSRWIKSTRSTGSDRFFVVQQCLWAKWISKPAKPIVPGRTGRSGPVLTT